MSNSVDVVAGTAATAAQYNNLRADCVNATTGHGHTGLTDGGLYIGYVPIGGIILWYGSLAQFNALPEAAHWKICDGTNGTVDLGGRFVIGVNGTYTQGSTGGAATFNWGHNHSSGTLATVAHDHSSSASGIPSAFGTLYYTIGTDTAGIPAWNHTHVCYPSLQAALTMTGSTSYDGGTAQSILPPYQALYYIQRIS
jgi:hypothetical protein